jgi:hypothetical protein
MNERIQELWEQAVHGDGPHASVIADFAELIVKRCAEVADQYVRDGDIDIAEIIRRDFEVKK